MLTYTYFNNTCTANTTICAVVISMHCPRQHNLLMFSVAFPFIFSTLSLSYIKFTYPASPDDSILFANSTSFEYTSYCLQRWKKSIALCMQHNRSTLLYSLNELSTRRGHLKSINENIPLSLP